VVTDRAAGRNRVRRSPIGTLLENDPARAERCSCRSLRASDFVAGAAVPRPCSVSSPRSSNRACGAAAHGFPRSFTASLPCTT